MAWTIILILAVIQGVTEPLPISSSGHLQLFESILGVSNNDLTYEIYLNFGSLIAIVILYKKLLKNIFSGTYKYVVKKKKAYYNNYKFFKLVFIASIPAAVIGFIFGDKIEAYFTNPKVTGIMLIITALFLFMIKDFKGKKGLKKFGIFDSIVIGFSQAIALIPGISRSGATITGAMFRNLNRELAFDFSFLMYIPISIGVFASKMGVGMETSNIKYMVGMLLAGLITYYTTKWFKNIVVNGKLVYLSGYCAVVGMLALVVL